MVQQVTLRLEAYSEAARRLIASAQGLADEREHAEVEPLHVLYRLAEQDEPSQRAMRDAGADPHDVLVEAELLIRRLPTRAGGTAYLSPRTLELLGRAEGEAARGGGKAVSVGHLLLATAQEAEGPARTVLASCGLSAPTLRAATAPGERASTQSSDREGGGKGSPLERYGKDLTRLAAQGRFDPTVGRDGELRRILSVLARRGSNNPLLVGEPGVGKSAIVQALAGRIARGDVPRMLQGKRLIELDAGALSAGARLRGELEQRISELLTALRDSGGEVILYLRDLSALLGERAPETVASLLARALRDGELRAIAVADPGLAGRLLSNGDGAGRYFVRVEVDPPTVEQTVAILRGIVGRFEVAHGLEIADPALTAAASFARRYLPSVQLPRSAIDLIDEAAAQVRVQVESVPAELDALQRRLESVNLQLTALADDHDADSKATRDTLEAEKGTLEPSVAELQTRWQAQVALVERVGVLKKELAAADREIEQARAAGDQAGAKALYAGSRANLERQLQAAEAALLGEDGDGEGQMVRLVVGESDVAAVVSSRTGVPVARMLEGEAEKLLKMEERLGARVIGQAQAVRALSRAVRRGRVGLRDGKRPIGSFLFLGTTGVGKTELAKALAEFLFDDEGALTRLDMSEFMEKHTVARLLGSPPGYVDSEEGGFLTEAVRRKPYSVLLFDEIEKAHPDVFNILLQVLDDGRLTDSRGRLAHFADTVVILTSNIGARRILEHSERLGGGEVEDGEALHDAIHQELRATLRPEFLNRIDDIIIFETLDRDDLGKIADLQLRGLARMLRERHLTLKLDDAAKGRIVELGYEPAFGARPLKRVITRELQDPLAEELLRGAYEEGDGIEVSVEDDGETLRFRKA
ncbi:MAG: AAA family ATPase [Myxococcales bacterium]|nr:AAA family ATPase [Myxococcales bacterium]